MFANRHRCSALLAGLLALSGGDVAHARDGVQANQRQAEATQPARISAGRAANIAQSASGAKVLAVKFRRGYYRVKLLRSNGVIFSVKVDAYTGRISR